MEDAATAEISRSQIWQWLHNDVTLDDTGEKVTSSWSPASWTRKATPFAPPSDQSLAAGHYQQARDLFEQVALDDDFVEFLTLPAYDLVD